MKTLRVIAFLCACIGTAFPQSTVTVSGHLITGSGGTSSSNVSVLWELINDSGQICKVSATGIIVPTSFSVTQAQLAAGISLIPNNLISCGTTLGVNRWRYTVKSGGIGTRQCSLNITGTTNLDSTSCLNALPTTPIPATGDSLYARLDGTNAGFTGSISGTSFNFSGNGKLQGALSIGGPSPWIDPTAAPYNCAGDGTTDDTACIQSAITATNLTYGRLFLPPGKKFFIGCTGASPCLSSSRAIEIFGGSNFASQFIVPTAIANTKRFITLLNDGTDGYNLHDFSIVCQGGTCDPLSLVNIDVTSNAIARMHMERVEELGTYGSDTCGLSLVNPANANGFFDSNIGPLNVIANGSSAACLQRIGDDVKFIDNTFVGSGTGINASCVPGALGLEIRHNVFVNSTAAIHIGDGCSGINIDKNQAEGHTGVTGSNGAYIDIDCTTTNPCVNVNIFNNHKIAPVQTNIHGIRLNWARQVQISGNAFFRAGGTAKDVVTTANLDPASSILWPNDFEPNPDTQANIIDDSLSTMTKVWGFPQSQAVNGGISAGMDFSRPVGFSQQVTFAAGQGIGSAAGGGAFVVPSVATPGSLVGTSGVQVLSNKSTAAGALAGTVGSGTASMTTAGILTGACGTTVTVAATGVLTTDVINVTRNAAATIGNGGGLTLNAWPTSGNVNFNYCNSSAGTITPTAMTVNWSVTR